MAFNIALSGIRAANKDLDVTGNNIANASTTGFKTSRAEFGDVYASTLLGSGSNTPGSGVNLQKIRQQFGQGNLNFTENQLDLAINGEGMFILDDSGDRLYGRDGTFGLDKNGYIVNNTGSNLQGYAADDQGNLAGTLSSLQVDVNNQPPQQTSKLATSFNLDSRNEVPTTATFDHEDPSSYNNATSATLYDSLGNPHTLTQYFVKSYDANNPPPTTTPPTSPNTWSVYAYIDGNSVQPTPLPAGVGEVAPGVIPAVPANPGPPPTAATPAGLELTFNADGSLKTNGKFSIPLDANNGSDPTQTIAVDYGDSSQYGSTFSVEGLNQDGYTTGRLAGVDIDEKGKIFARFTNGEAQSIGQVALASFNNVEALKPVGSTLWAQTADSGEAVAGGPGSASLGNIQAGALEESNVDLSSQLVNLIIAQRNFQANSKTIETANQTTQTIINLR